MNVEEEIRYRREIMTKARNGRKLKPEERLWLVTHCVYNREMGPPYLNTDVIRIQVSVKYRVRIRVESVKYSRWIIPVITVPGGKGRIETQNDLFDLDGKKVLKKIVKMLGVLIDSHFKETEIVYQSDVGLLGISFECEYFDDKQKLMIRKSSDTGTSDFAMVREVVSENKIIYHCKPPTEDGFDGYVFSVEWIPIG